MNFSLKWPNDVMAGRRKLAGILLEAEAVPDDRLAVVVGIGVNVHTRDFPDDLADRATSISLVSRTPPDRAAVLADVLACLDRDLHVVVSRGLGLLRVRLEAADALRGRRVRSDTGDEGTASGIDDDGRLLVTRDDGVVTRWSAGEVHLLG